MELLIPKEILKKIYLYGEASYPEEGAGFLLGQDTPVRRVEAILELANARENQARHNRYLITPQDYLWSEDEAERLGLSLIGVFHSHPDHPDQPSEFDREWAQPWFSYLITSVQNGVPMSSRSWRLLEDHSAFVEEKVLVEEPVKETSQHSSARVSKQSFRKK